MSGLDDLLGGLLGGKSGTGRGDLGSVLGGLTGGQGSGASAGGAGLLTALVPMLGGLLANGGLNKILGGFQKNGFAEQADSWVGRGENEPVSGGDVRQVLGDEEIDQIAARLGVSREQAADALAEVLPQVVDRVSPEGQLPPESDLDSLFDRAAGTTA